MKRKLSLLLAGLLVCTLATGCGSASTSQYEPSASSAAAATELYREETPAEAPVAYSGDYMMKESADEAVMPEGAAYDDTAEAEVDYDESGEVATGGDAGIIPPISQPSIETNDRKIVYTVDLSLQTTAFDEGVKQIPEMVESIGGFVQDSYVQGNNMNERYYSRSASFTVRVPVERLASFTEELGGIFHVVSQQKSSSDISNSYYDTQARLDSLRIQEERLKAMLETADELQYLLEVERELAEVLYEIESMTSSLRRMDSSVNLSTITIHLQEVSIIEDSQPEPKPVTFGDRVQETFGDSVEGFVSFCQDVVLFVISLIPFLPVFLVIALVVWLLIRSSRKRRANRPPRRHAYPQYPAAPAQPPAPVSPSAPQDPVKKQEPAPEPDPGPKDAEPKK